MIWTVRVLLSKWAALIQRASLRDALALPPRGGLRNDSLTLKHVRSRIAIEWNARDVHPWDWDDSGEMRAQGFLEQFLAETETVIERILQTLPQIDTIDITVRDPASERVIASGTLDRFCSNPGALASVRMRLMARGIKLHLDEARFERLQPAGAGR